MRQPERLPIKVVPALESDYYKPDGGGGPKKVFDEVTPEIRQGLAAQVIDIRNHLASSFSQYPGVPAVAKVKIKADALAKSHRPTALLTERTCPIIGAEGMGNLLLSVTPQGLENLARQVEQNATKQIIANLSTLSSFEAFVADDEYVREELPEELLKPVKVKLFTHHLARWDEALLAAFRNLLREQGVRNVREVRYGPGLKIFKVEPQSLGILEELRHFVGTQSLSDFPIYFPVRTAAIPVRAVAPDDFPPPDPAISYPVVGVIDSGTSPTDPLVSSWVVAREEYVPPALQDNTHGSFVTSLIVNGRKLNHDDNRFPSVSAKVVDVVALGKGGAREDELLTIIEDVLPKYPDVKVWNLSLGTSLLCSDHTFSELAVALDRLQDEHGVTFVLAAGNYASLPLRTWPPDLKTLGETDRICAPADSIRSIVVGSVAHRDHHQSCVKGGEPSPFSRRGPGPLYLPRPELAHIGGNCNNVGNCSQIGVLALDGKGNVAEDIGTSFATPLVSALTSHVKDGIVGGASRSLTRALLVHSAALKTGKVDPNLLPYQGFGTPGDLEDILSCEPWSATLIFELELESNVSYQKAVFPMPPCLYVNEDTVRANILMTLAYEPPLDAAFGSEYCRSNIEVSLGTYNLADNGKRRQKKQVPEDPRLRGSAYEEDLVKNGFKWSPIKVYRRHMVHGVQGELWRLDLELLHRSGYTPRGKQRAALVISVADPDKKAPVYNDMVVAMNRLGWAAQDLQIQSRLRP